MMVRKTRIRNCCTIINPCIRAIFDTILCHLLANQASKSTLTQHHDVKNVPAKQQSCANYPLHMEKAALDDGPV